MLQRWEQVQQSAQIAIMYLSHVSGSIVVSIPACHAGDPGSIPGLRDFFPTVLKAGPELWNWNQNKIHSGFEFGKTRYIRESP